MASSDRRPKVALIGTGGTISLAARHSRDVYEYMEFGERQDAGQILARFPEIADVADVRPVDFRALSSASVTPADWLDLAACIDRLDASPDAPDGIVVTHGTATLEETAYFLNLTLKTSRPVVVAGAQRPLDTIGSDAGMNLLNAVEVAAAPEARGLGVLVLLNEEIQAAREVTKTSTNRLETFRSPDLGMLGYADADGRVAIYRRPARCHAPDTVFDVRGRRSLPRVDIVPVYAGADAVALDAYLSAGADGLVIAGLAPGLATPAIGQAMAAARSAGVLVVQSTRAGSGRVLRRTSMRELGIVAADNLTPQKARVLAMLALTVTDDPERVQEMFDLY